jgi:LPS O-antigen subunit length determinant protein (WzzB/FepE family)
MADDNRSQAEIPEIRLRLTVAAALGVMALASILAFLTAPSWRAEITFTAAAIAGAAGIYSAYYAGLALRINLHRERQKHSFDLLDRFNGADFIKARVLIDGLQ